MFRYITIEIYLQSLCYFLVIKLHSLFFFNKETLYIYIENPQKHFAYKMHVAKELADKLKEDGIEAV